MRLLSRISTWWRAVSRGRELDRQIDEELRFHIESYAQDLVLEVITIVAASAMTNYTASITNPVISQR